MSWHWVHLLPIDRYIVRTAEELTEREHKWLTLLYQPLIGPAACSLYTTLSRRLEHDCYTSPENTHHDLTAMIGIQLDHLYEERRKLEGIGLLKTYKKKEEESTLFFYELQSPMSPQQFFQDDVLSVFLYNKLGKEKYKQLKMRFTLDTLPTDDSEEITASFDEVFSSLHHSEMLAHDEEVRKDLLVSENDKYVKQQSEKPLPFTSESFDFELLKADLPTFLSAEEILTKEVKEAITRLAFVYRLDPLEMSRIIQQSLASDDTVELGTLRKQVQNWYRFEYGNQPPALGMRTQPFEYQTMKEKEPRTEEEKMIHFYENTSPITFLESISDGAKVPHADVKLVESLLFDYQLRPGVVNVLIDYIMKTNNMKLQQALVYKVAGHWSRKHLNTVKEAMELAKGEYQSRKRSKNEGRSPQGKQRATRPYVRKDRLPKWIEEDVSSDEKNIQTEQQPTHDESERFESERKRFEEMMKKRKDSRKKRGEMVWTPSSRP